MTREALAGAGDRVDEAGHYHALPDPVSDRLMSLVMTLAAEVWTVRDRLVLVEAALAERGIELASLIEQRRDDPERLEQMRQDLDRFVVRFLRPVTPDEPSDDGTP